MKNGVLVLLIKLYVRCGRFNLVLYTKKKPGLQGLMSSRLKQRLYVKGHSCFLI